MSEDRVVAAFMTWERAVFDAYDAERAASTGSGYRPAEWSDRKPDARKVAEFVAAKRKEAEAWAAVEAAVSDQQTEAER